MKFTLLAGYMKLEATCEDLSFEFTDVVPSLLALFSVE